MRRILLLIIVSLSLFPIKAHCASVEMSDNLISRHLTIAEGLSSMGITSMTMDDSKCLWVGTEDGFDFINNGAILAFTSSHNRSEETSSPIGYVHDIKVKDGIAIIASENGLFTYCMAKSDFNELLLEGNHIEASAIEVGSDAAYVYDAASCRLAKFILGENVVSTVKDFSSEKYLIEKIIETGSGIILMADNHAGIIKMNSEGNCSIIITAEQPIIASATFVDSKGRLWIADEENGAYAFSNNVINRIVEPIRFGNNHIRRIYEDKDGRILVATNFGCFVAEGNGKGECVAGTEHLDITSVCSASGRDLIIGTRFKGITMILDSAFSYLDVKNLANRSVLSALVARDGKLWFGTTGNYLVSYDENAKESHSYTMNSMDNISSLAQLDDNHLLLFDRNRGLNSFDMRSGAVSPFRLEQELLSRQSLSHNDRILLLGTKDGSTLVLNLGNNVCKIKDGHQTFAQIIPDGSEENVNMAFAHDYTNILVSRRSVYSMENMDKVWTQSLFTTDEDIISACIDKDCNVWYLTKSGIWEYTLSVGDIKKILTDEDGNSYSSLLCGGNGDRLWVTGSDCHLYCYDISTDAMKVYSYEDGLPDGFVFRPISVSTAKNSYFAGSSGLISIPSDKPISVLKDNGFEIKCLSVLVDDEVIIPKKDRYVINHDYNQLKIRLVLDGPCPVIPSRFKYEFSNSKGIVLASGISDEPSIHLGRIPGNDSYSLRVAGFGNSGWQPMHEIATISRSRDLRQKVGIFIHLVAFLALLVLAVILFIRKKAKRPEESHENHVVLPLTAVESRKHNPNLSMSYHESFELGMKTSLSVIRDSVQAISSGTLNEQQVKEKADNALVDLNKTYDILDMLIGTKDEDVKSNLSTFDLNKSVSIGIAEAIEGKKFGDRKIIFNPQGNQLVNTNKKIIENVIRALLFNAYNNDGDGDVKVDVSLTNVGNIRLSVMSCGVAYKGDYDELFNGTAEDNPFDELSMKFLVNCRYSMEQLGGTLAGFRNVDAGGSTFYADIPSTKASKEAFKVQDSEIGDFEDGIDIPETEDFDTRNQTLLFVDDEDDMREFLYDEYKDKFKEIYLAKDGKEGLDIVRTKLPNIIVSDIKMPRMTGFELCKTIKSDIEISHLPVILLTSLDESKSQAIGYKMGADVFIPKPFDSQILYTAMQTLLRNRFEIKKRYSTATLPVITEEQTFSVADESFVLNLNKFINENIDNPDLNVEMLADGLCVSRSTLFNKMNSIIGVSAAKYIKKIRLERAKELLKNTGKSILDIAIEIGFTESQYFSTAFKQETGETPSQFRNNNRK